ncbi:MAG: hypothetical protein CVU52_08010 [Deltaproteobacteria bacterium HGW-Deltaproteobacteria-10]|nr:MAG: hypothetical protein CVU52_08010 [Deltaproteobacteria bacterium HGW-Deltaproteobacteria-10]
MKKWLVVFLLVWVTPVMAADVSFQSGMTQQMFQDFSKYAASALVYRAVGPAASLGITGFDIGVEVTATSVDSGKDYWKKAFQNQDAPSYILAPKLHVQKGLPFDIDAGLVYSKVPGTDIQYIGGELKYTAFKGGALWPAVAVRGSYSQVMGVEQLDFKTYGLELAASKGFGVGLKVTPYASIGYHWISSTPKSLPAGIQLSSESFSLARYAVGAQFKIMLVTITAEADYVQVPSYTLRAGITW